jgi:two-component system cell cycle sensor histidine kinase/response regulator CckA
MRNIEPTDIQRLLKSFPGLFVVLRPDFKVVTASDSYLRAARKSLESIEEKDFFEVFPDSAVIQGDNDVRASLKEVLQTQAPVTMTIRKQELPRPANEGGGALIKYWQAINTPIMNKDGVVDYIIRSVEDVTSYVNDRTERKIIEQERDIFFSYSFDLLGIVGIDGFFKRVNPSFERVLGFTEEEMYSLPIIKMIHPNDVEKTTKGLQKLAAGTPTVGSINRYRCKDGSYKWFSWNTVPMGDLHFTIGRDITEQVKSEEQIRQLNHDLASRNEDLESKIHERLSDLQRSEAQVQQLQKMDAIGRLSGGIAHDFNNMLGAISLYCELIEEVSSSPTSVKQQAQNILKVVSSASALTRQLLLFSRKQIGQLQTVQLDTLIQEVEHMLIRLIGENIRIVTKFSSDSKPVSVDPNLIEQVLLNLVVNAKDAMPQGGVITIETSQVYLDEAFINTHLSVIEGHYVLLSVADDGVGMDSDTMSKIFEPFFTTKAVGKGTGLGLTTTYGIIKQSKGTIWVYSELGKGTVFKIYLPVSEKLTEVAKTDSRKLPEVQGSETILLVEDDENLRLGFAAVLRKRGYQVLEAANGQDALRTIESYQGPIHLLLTDMIMPGINGFQLAQKCQSLRQDLRVLYMSGYTNDSLENSGLDSLGSLDFIQKPFGSNALVTKLQEVMSRSPKTFS